MGDTKVLLIDDGELDDVAGMLDELSVPYERMRGAVAGTGLAPPSELLVSTPRRIVAVEWGVGEPELPVRVVVTTEDSTTLRGQLRKQGFDYLVRRPIHPEALRLLLMHCLFEGDDRRDQTRIPVGLDVTFQTGSLPRHATLADLSNGGCRILSPYALEPATRIRVEIPGESPNGNPECLTLEGRVLRIHLDERLGQEGLYSTAVAFDETSIQDAGETLERMVTEWANARIVPSELASRDEVCSAGSSGDRRKRRRSSYIGGVPTIDHPDINVLVGRDLSAGGMRVDPNPALSMGDRIRLAIFRDDAAEPVEVWGTVARDDGHHGIAVHFDPLEADATHQIERLVASLPAIESLHDDEATAMGTVFSKIVDAR